MIVLYEVSSVYMADVSNKSTTALKSYLTQIINDWYDTSRECAYYISKDSESLSAISRNYDNGNEAVTNVLIKCFVRFVKRFNKAFNTLGDTYIIKLIEDCFNKCRKNLNVCMEDILEELQSMDCI